MRIFRRYTFHISEAQSDDYSALEVIHEKSFDHPWSADELAATLAVRGTRCYVANIKGNKARGPKGFLIVRQVSDEAEILTIAVDRSFRRMGIARSLIEHVVRILQGERTKNLFLEVGELNHPALGLYRSLGFRKVGERKAYYRVRGESAGDEGSSRANALVMELDLP